MKMTVRELAQKKFDKIKVGDIELSHRDIEILLQSEEDIKAGRVVPAEVVFEELRREFGY